MTALKRIQVKGFKSIREMDLELRPLNILIGANGSGKSNFLSVFRLLNQLHNLNFEGYVRKLGGADRFLYFGKK
jgi:predicted ATPase